MCLEPDRGVLKLNDDKRNVGILWSTSIMVCYGILWYIDCNLELWTVSIFEKNLVQSILLRVHSVGQT